MSEFTYEFCFHMYGLKNVAEKKFVQLLSGVIKNKQCVRVRLFGNFLEVFSDIPSSFLKLYLQMTEYLLGQNIISYKIEFQETDEEVFVPYVRAQELLRLHFEHIFTASTFREKKAEVNN